MLALYLGARHKQTPIDYIERVVMYSWPVALAFKPHTRTTFLVNKVLLNIHILNVPDVQCT